MGTAPFPVRRASAARRTFVREPVRAAEKVARNGPRDVPLPTSLGLAATASASTSSSVVVVVVVVVTVAGGSMSAASSPRN